MHINEAVKWVGDWAIRKGWRDIPKPPLEIHMLIVTEIAEATEEARKKNPDVYEVDGKWEGEATELVDAVIRIFDYFALKGWDFEDILKKKMEYNESRPYRHGNKAH